MSNDMSDDVFFLEVRPGEGGEDAARFADELYAALRAFASRNRLDFEDQTSSDARTLVARVSGSKVDAHMGWLCGTHRVQRVPANDRARRHTSTATVALLAEVRTRAVVINDDDLELQVYRGSGPGGQHRNKTSTAVRLRHKPSGIVVVAEDSRSQRENLDKARAKLVAALRAAGTQAATEQRDDDRRRQIAGADRAAKSFTHVVYRGEVVDHTTGRRWRLTDFRRGRIRP